VFGAVVVESACIGALGALAGFGVYAVLFASVAHVIRAQTGVVLSLTELHPVLALAPAGLVALCALGGVIPAIKAYRLPVAENLSPIS
jgi:putative ABC transport system permease protein